MPPARASVLAIAALALIGCGSAPAQRPSSPTSLIDGTRSPIPPRELQGASARAHRFARAYAEAIYESAPPPLPATTRSVGAAIRSAASRVPPSRRGLHPRAVALSVSPEGAGHASATVTIADGRSPSFSVGFTLSLRRGHWLITAISAPG